MATKNKAVKKAVKKAAKKAAPSNGAAELKAFRAAIQGLKATGSALAKAARSNKSLRSNAGVRSAVASAQNAAAAVAKLIPSQSAATIPFGGG